MARFGLLALVLLFAGCESDNIRACGEACAKTGNRMARHEPNGGCICDTPQAASDGGAK